LNPIEKMWSKLKAILRTVQARGTARLAAGDRTPLPRKTPPLGSVAVVTNSSQFEML
jgi:hypothetical protein